MRRDPPSANLPWLVTSGQQDPQTVDRLLRSLPEWFGTESSNIGYVEAAARLPTYLAWPAGDLPAPGQKRQAVGGCWRRGTFPRPPKSTSWPWIRPPTGAASAGRWSRHSSVT